TEIYHTGNYLEGISELETMISRNGGHSFVTLSYSKYLGPVGIEQYNTDQFERLLTPQLVQRLRDNNWARPAKITEPWCDYLIVQPLEGYPVVFHLADFGEYHVDKDFATKYRMIFPPQLLIFLMGCTGVFIHDYPALMKDFANTYWGTSFMRNWDDGFNKIEFYDLGRYDKHSDLGGLPSGVESMMDLYSNPLPRFRSLIDIGAQVTQDRLKFSSEKTLCRNRLGDAWEHRHILMGLIPNGCMRDSRMVKELPTLSWMVSNCHILWMELLSEIIYHPALIENAYTWRNSATTEDQMWDLDGSILSKIVPILESKCHPRRSDVGFGRQYLEQDRTYLGRQNPRASGEYQR
ncbi:MAG: hypothetical protein GY820_22205, partial [Gammaproteobacteria bacterium]|nr:hypothetical protein [Gammaproteobacteria bacterium]